MINPHELRIHDNKSELHDQIIQFDPLKELSSKLNDKIDAYFLEGLKRKGFTFNNKNEVETFVKVNCRCEDNPKTEERLYFVNNIPFFYTNMDWV